MSSSTKATRPTTRTLQILPVEIWTMILESTIHVPRLFDTTCTDVSFARYRVLGSKFLDGEAAYRESERQRLIMRNVVLLGGGGQTHGKIGISSQRIQIFLLRLS
jgi:hypothetical protein